MTTSTTPNQPAWIVVVNSQQQYSIWAADKPLPNGWQRELIPANWLQAHQSTHPQDSAKAVCLAYIGDVWQDLTPLSVRQHLMALSASNSTATLTAKSA